MKVLISKPPTVTLETFAKRRIIDARTADESKLVRTFALMALRMPHGEIANLHAMPAHARTVYEAVVNLHVDRSQLQALAHYSDDKVATLAHDVLQEQFKIITREREKLARRESLAREIFGENAEMVAPVEDVKEESPLTGKYPKRPKPAKGSTVGTVFTVTEEYLMVSKLTGLKWRDCPAKYHKKVMRLCKQVEQEMIAGNELMYRVFSSRDEFDKFATRCRLRRLRDGIEAGYKGHRLIDGTIAVIFHVHPKEQGEPVPTDKGKLFALVSSWVDELPEKTRALVSNDWGGKYQGSDGDGRVMQARKAGKDVVSMQFWSYKHPKTFAKVFDMELNKDGKGRANMEPVEVLERLTNAGIPFYARGGKNGWDTFMNAFMTENVTDKRHSEAIKNLLVAYPLQNVENEPENALLPALSATQDDIWGEGDRPKTNKQPAFVDSEDVR